MTYLGLAGCLALITFGAVSLLASLVVWPAARRHLGRAEPRGGTLLALRFAPTLAAAVAVGAIVLPAFLRLEPRHSGESIGVAMLILAASVACMVVAGPLRALRSVLATRALVRRWRAGAAEAVLPGWRSPAFAIDEAVPPIAVVGVVRPRLYVARQVLERCTRDELVAIVAHETAHVSRRDNLKRLLLRSCPDLVALTPLGARIERVWSEASDRQADDYAAERTGSRLDLAAALVKVARSLGAPAPAGGALAAFCREAEISTRVRRLLHPTRQGVGGLTPRRLALVAGPVLLALAAIAQHAGVAARIHGVAEAVVRFLQ
jgi:hypothetical protein